MAAPGDSGGATLAIGKTPGGVAGRDTVVTGETLGSVAGRVAVSEEDEGIAAWRRGGAENAGGGGRLSTSLT
jgi:hypothetical protein